MDVERILRDVGLAESMQSAETLILLEDLRRVVMRGGKVDPRALPGYVLGFDWDPGSTGRIRVKRAGTLTILAADCDTAPSTGDATVTLSMKRSDNPGATLTIGTLTIPQGQTMADTTLGVAVPANSWLTATVTTANGASGVSISATEDVGGS